MNILLRYIKHLRYLRDVSNGGVERAQCYINKRLKIKVRLDRFFDRLRILGRICESHAGLGHNLELVTAEATNLGP